MVVLLAATQFRLNSNHDCSSRVWTAGHDSTYDYELSAFDHIPNACLLVPDQKSIFMPLTTEDGTRPYRPNGCFSPARQPDGARRDPPKTTGGSILCGNARAVDTCATGIVWPTCAIRQLQREHEANTPSKVPTGIHLPQWYQNRRWSTTRTVLAVTILS